MPPAEKPDTDRWSTPAWVIALARETMGGIDLDPASHREANEIVDALAYYTKSYDGLKHDWARRIWCNPPYGKVAGVGQVGVFLDKLIEEFAVDHASEGLILTNVCTGSAWFRRMWDWPLCFFSERIRFVLDGGIPDSPRFDNVVAYVAPEARWDRFRAIFEPHGRIVLPARHGLAYRSAAVS